MSDSPQPPPDGFVMGPNAKARMIPIVGFTLAEKRHGPHDPQRLGYWWLEKDGTHYGFEMAITDQHPEMVALQLRQLSEAILEKHRGHNGKKYRRKK